jgi:hypothetical protein
MKKENQPEAKLTRKQAYVIMGSAALSLLASPLGLAAAGAISLVAAGVVGGVGRDVYKQNESRPKKLPALILGMGRDTYGYLKQDVTAAKDVVTGLIATADHYKDKTSSAVGTVKQKFQGFRKEKPSALGDKEAKTDFDAAAENKAPAIEAPKPPVPATRTIPKPRPGEDGC